MNNPANSYLEDWFARLDEHLKQALREIDKRHGAQGTFGDKEYWDERNSIIQGIKSKKEELKRTFEDKQHIVELLKKEVLLQDARIPLNLSGKIPSNKKYTELKRIAKIFEKKWKVSNHILAACIIPTILGQNNQYRRFRKTDYDKKKYENKIKNRLKILNKKILKPLGYRVKFNTQFTELINVQK